MKKTLLLLVALITATIAFAQTEINGIYYNLNNSNQTAEVTYQYHWDENNYSGVTSITIPEKVTYNSTEYSVTSIDHGAFKYCSSLTSITIPNSVTSIGGGAFNGCSSLTSITIPNSVTLIDFSAFSDTPWLSNQPDGFLYIGKCLYQYRGKMPENTHIDVKEGTTMICSGAFQYRLSLTSITIPNSVTSIGSYAFEYCTSLTSITIPNSVTFIGKSAFERCSSLTSITIPNSVTFIGMEAFSHCESLTSITIPNSVTEIESGAFSHCESLTSITIPNSVTEIESGAFSDCSSLTSITCLGSTPPSTWYLGAQYETTTLFVPKGSLNNYKDHTEWGKFSNIQEL